MLLLLTLTFQSVWGAAEAYCRHEAGGAAQHVGHHVHELAQFGDHASADAPEQAPDQAKAKSSLAADHDHHCCSIWVVLAQSQSTMPGVVKFSELLATPVSLYRSADPRPIERPNWPTSL